MAGNAVNNGDKNSLLFPGKIAVVTNLPSYTQNEEEFLSAEQLVAKYGAEKVIHANWPSYQEQEQVYAIVASLAVDREVKALIMNQAIPGCNTAVDKLKRIRDDIFVVGCAIHESPSSTAAHVDLVLDTDGLGMGPAMVKQAKKQGAKVFVHYSFPRHMALAHLAMRRDMIQAVCESEGLLFVNASALDPTGDAGVYDAQQFILDDVPKLVAKYGEDVAFFSTNCFLQIPLIRSVIDNHAIFPQPCCPSPFHGFPEALGIEVGEGLPDVNYMIAESKRIIASKDMTGRLSSWPISLSMMLTHVGAEYAIKWINGQVPKTGIDDKVLIGCMKSYIKEVSGEDTGIFIDSYSEQGTAYNNFKLVLMDYLDY